MNQSDRKRQLLVSGMIAAIFLAVALLLTHKASGKQAEAPPKDPNSVTVSPEGGKVVGLKVTKVMPETVQSPLHLSGQVNYAPDSTVKVAPRLSGRVNQVFVTVGDKVHAGQTLAIIDSVDAAAAETTYLQNSNKLRLSRNNLQRQRNLYRLGTSDVTTARAALDQAKATTEAAKKVLDLTKQQDRIGGFTQKPVEDAENAVAAARSALSQAESDLRMAKADHERKLKLLAIGVAAKADEESSRDTLEKAQASEVADAESLGLAEQALARERKAYGSNLYADQQLQQAESSYRQALLQQAAAEKALRLAEVQIERDLQQAQSDYESAELDTQNSSRTLAILGSPGADGTLRITSPIDGVVTERDVSPGQVVDQSQMTPWQMFVISNSTKVWVQVDVYEKDLSLISPGQLATVRVAALSGRDFKGRVVLVAPTLDPRSRSVKVRVELDNKAGELKDGEYAEVEISGKGAVPKLLIPLTAVQHDGENDYVYVKQADRYVRRSIKAGPIFGEKCECESGLTSGETIVSQGAIFLGDQENDQ